MQNLAGQLSAVDHSAGEALAVIAYFDKLAQSRAGLEAVVRGAAVLSGVPARLVDPARRILIRVAPDGTRQDTRHAADTRWRRAEVFPAQAAAIWLETSQGGSLVHDMVLERAALVAGLIITRVRGAELPEVADCALTETVLDVHVPQHLREAAARSMGFPDGASARVAAFPGGDVVILAAAAALPDEGRIGVGPVVPVADLPRSADRARTALRFTADGTAQDPGSRVAHAADLGALAHLATAIDAGATPSDDLDVLRGAASTTPWLVATLTAFVAEPSIRAAAATLFLHHSTLQDRLDHAERILGWQLREPRGRLRLDAVLAERLLTR